MKFSSSKKFNPPKNNLFVIQKTGGAVSIKQENQEIQRIETISDPITGKILEIFIKQ